MKKISVMKWIAILTIAISVVGCQQDLDVKPNRIVVCPDCGGDPGPDPIPFFCPDLTIESIILDHRTLTPTFLELGITMSNIGNASAEISNISGSNNLVYWVAYLSVDGNTIAQGITPASKYFNGVLGAGGTTQPSMSSFKLPSNRSLADYPYIIIYINSGTGVGECTLSNNRVVVRTPGI